MTAPDFNGQRETIRAKIAGNEEQLAIVNDRLGALALDTALGLAGAEQVADANAQLVTLKGNALALGSALAEIDKREAAQQAKDAAAEQTRMEHDRTAAEVEMHTASKAALAALDKFAGHVVTAIAAENRAVSLGARLGVSRRYGVGVDLKEATLAALSTPSAPLMPQQPPKTGDLARARLQALKVAS